MNGGLPGGRQRKEQGVGVEWVWVSVWKDEKVDMDGGKSFTTM